MSRMIDGRSWRRSSSHVTTSYRCDRSPCLAVWTRFRSSVVSVPWTGRPSFWAGTVQSRCRMLSFSTVGTENPTKKAVRSPRFPPNCSSLDNAPTTPTLIL